MNQTQIVVQFCLCCLLLSVLTGCAKLQHLDQLLTLKGMSEEKDRMDVYIEAQDKKFKSLIDAYQDKTLAQYKNKSKVVRKFGEPIYKNQVQKDGQDLELWIYRYSMKYFDSEKIHLYFDPKGNLITSEYLPAPVTRQSA